MLVEVIRHAMWRRRVEAARAWSAAERQQVAEHREAVQRIIDQAPTVPDPVGRR